MMYRATSANATWQIFWYEKNLQGDVVAVYSHDGVKLVSYAYDAWGNFTTTTHVSGTAASKNPIRYRSYYYDSDIGLYYLGTRWYSPRFHRFLSPDNVDVTAATPGALTDKNLYAYCDNNPVMRVDYTGEFWNIVFGALFGGIFGGLVNVGMQLLQNGGDFQNLDWGSIVNSTITGTALGLSTALGISYLGPMIAGTATFGTGAVATAFCASVGVSAMAGGGGYIAQEVINGRGDDIDPLSVVGHASIVSLESVFTFGIGGMVGSMNPSIGKNGRLLSSKEWYVKFAITQEFSNGVKLPFDKLRKGLWG